MLLNGNFNCTGKGSIGDLWNTIVTEGLDTGAPYVSFNDLMTTAPPAGGGTQFNAGWAAATALNPQILGATSTLNTANTAYTAAAALPPQGLNFMNPSGVPRVWNCKSAAAVTAYIANGTVCP